MRTGLYNLLATSSALTSLVSASNIFLTKLPNDYPVSSLPAISFMLVTGSTQLSLDRAEVRKASVQIDLWGNDPVILESIETAIHQSLSGYTGVLSDGTRILEITSSNVIDGWEVDMRVYRTILEFSILFA